MRIVLLVLNFSLLSFVVVYGQNNISFTQFYQNPQLYNPAFTGIESFLDLKLGRKQNLGAYDFAPKTSFLSVNAPFNASKVNSIQQYSLRISDPELYNEIKKFAISPIKHGLGLTYLKEDLDLFTQQRLQLSYALHFSLSDKLKFAAAISPYFFSNRVNWENIRFEVPDLKFSENSGINYSRISINVGGVLYSDDFYAGYSALQIFDKELSKGVSDTDSVEVKNRVSHGVTGGYRLQLNERFELLPTFLATFTASRPTIFNINTKLRIDQRYWGGFSYWNTGILSLVTGVVLNDWIQIGYSYDYTIKGISNYASGSHELVVGVMLFRNSGGNPYMW